MGYGRKEYGSMQERTAWDGNSWRKEIWVVKERTVR